MDCLFCKLINKEIPAKILFEDDDVLAFEDINPHAPFHGLVIPKKHIHTLNDVTEEDHTLVGKVIATAARLAKEHGFADDGYRTVFNCNPHGGQTVYHIHLHVLGGKPLGWPPYQDSLKVDV
jgi:histidine triad (HIT) family protein